LLAAGGKSTDGKFPVLTELHAKVTFPLRARSFGEPGFQTPALSGTATPIWLTAGNQDRGGFVPENGEFANSKGQQLMFFLLEQVGIHRGSATHA
jgi:hypothetical protein